MGDILKVLQTEGGSVGGVMIYEAAKAAAHVANVARKDRKLTPGTKRVLKPFFPKLNLNKVTFHINSTLPGNWFTRSNNISAMTFGYEIYFKGSNIRKSREGLKLLMHELVHVDQVRRAGSQTAFASQYGQGYLKGGSYKKNPMEVEAEEFVHKNGDSLPDGAPKE